MDRHSELTGTTDVYFVSITFERYNRRIHKIHSSINRMIILPAVLYVYETGHFIVSESQRLRLFKNRLLWRTLEPKSDKVTGE